MVGQEFESILKGKYPSREHARKAAQLLLSKVPSAHGVIYLQGRPTKFLEDSDEAEPFRYIPALPAFRALRVLMKICEVNVDTSTISRDATFPTVTFYTTFRKTDPSSSSPLSTRMRSSGAACP